MITQFIATTETAVPHGVFFWRILLTAPGIGLMLAFGLIAICSLFTWLGGEDVSEVFDKIASTIFPVFGKVCIIHFILTILATLFFEKTEEETLNLQIRETILFLGLWLVGTMMFADRNTK